jgi:phosphomannomutase
MMDNLEFSNISDLIENEHIKINFGTDGFRGIMAENFDFNKISIISSALGLYLLKKNKSKNKPDIKSDINSEGNSYSCSAIEKNNSLNEKNGINSKKNILSRSIARNASSAATFSDIDIPSIAIGYDTRFLSKEFALSCAKNLVKMGFNVLVSDFFCPSPVLSYSVKNNLCECGIMITASHNAFMYNGIKFKNNYGGSMLESDVKKIEEIANCILSDKERLPHAYFSDNAKSGELIKTDFKKKYLDHIIKIIDIGAVNSPISKNIFVVIDPMYGAGIGYISDALKKFSIRHRVINNSINPNFPGINPEPIEFNLKKLSRTVKKAGADNKFAVGFATDGDADRIGAVDYKGNFIDSHKIFSILLNYLLEEGFKGEVVKTVSVSKTIDYLCGKYKVRLHEVPIGFKNIANLMINPKNNILIGGEESGGIGIKLHIPERDGVFNSLMLLKIMLVREKNLNELLNDIYDKEYPLEYKRLDIHIDNNIKEKLIKILKNNNFNIPFKEKIAAINLIDGYKFEYTDNSWLLIRTSGTEPVLRIYAESAEKKRTVLLIEKAINEINKIT